MPGVLLDYNSRRAYSAAAVARAAIHCEPAEKTQSACWRFSQKDHLLFNLKEIIANIKFL